MIFNINADKILNIHEGFEREIEKYLSEELQRFDESLTRADVYITDENGIKDGLNDIRCLLEAHLKGRQSVVVAEEANNPEQAIHAAAKKLKYAIDSVIGKSRNHLESETFK